MNYHEMIAKGFTGEPYSMFFHVWPWIGLGAAIVLLILIFCTDFLRSDKTKSRFLDPVSLAWMGAVIYMLHNLDEAARDGRVCPMNASTLIMDILSLNVFAFIAYPIIQEIRPDIDIEAFYEERKRENLEIIRKRLIPNI